MVRVEQQSESRFVVTVADERGQSRHSVTVSPEYAKKLTGGKGATPKLIQESFEFLLAREPKEDIVPEFELSVITRYFPEYESEIRKIRRA